MTVAAIVAVTPTDDALADAVGRPAVRRIVDAAWAGGATPIIVATADPDGAISASLRGSPAVVVPPAPGGEIGACLAGVRAARESVRETYAVLLWPARMTWVDPETVTSLIEGHGRAPDRVLRPLRADRQGWPVLVPSGDADRILRDAEGELAPLLDGLDGVQSIELGDPGTTHGSETPLDELPDYQGPPEPVGGPPPEWGAAAAETPDPELAP
jgi:CTP:molybdopterin cytidylyltransferase MocA